MEKIKQRIEKLLRLSLSENKHEAQLAAEKAMALMEENGLTRSDLEHANIGRKEIELPYGRIPKWLRKLYANMSFFNGCYMVWIDGYRGPNRSIIEKKAKIVLTGLESDLKNIEYYVDVLRIEIEKKAKTLKENRTPSRSEMQNYKMGLANGVYSLLLSSSKTYNENLGDKSIVPCDTRHANAKEYYLNKHQVRTVDLSSKKDAYYFMGIDDADSIKMSRSIEKDSEERLALTSEKSNACFGKIKI